MAREQMRAAEMAEVAYMRAMYDAASASTRAGLGLARRSVGGGEVFVMANDPTGGFWNRTIGLGIDRPISADIVDDVVTFARAAGAPLQCVQVAPDADPRDWEALLEAAGLVPSASWVKFAAPGGTTVEASTDLRVERLGAQQAESFGRVMAEGFGMPSDSLLPTWFSECVGRPGYTAYGAFDGADMVAAAALCVDDEYASLCGAATLPSARGRGAQSALMAIRLEDADAAGVRWIGTETGAETPEDPNPSLHNMRRLGLTELYERRNWIWKP